MARKILSYFIWLLAHPARFELTTSAFGGQWFRVSAGYWNNLTALLSLANKAFW